MTKKLLSFICTLVMVMALGTTGLIAADLKPVADLEKDYNNAIENTFAWAKQGNSQLFNSELLKSVGTTDGDWIAFAAGRYGYNDNNKAYLSALEDFVTKTYASKNGKLHAAKTTEWHRITFAVLALGGDPTSFGVYEGKKINLIADGVYNSKVTPLWKQGINGAIFGLLALDTKNYETPSNCDYDREAIIDEILSREIADGGFALDKDYAADTDITAMTLQALAPYYTKDVDVKNAVDRSLEWLSKTQLADGDYQVQNTPNTESTVQVLTALCALNIDPVNDSRFVKNGKTVLDGLQKYYVAKDGGFAHSFASDPENPGAVSGESNNMATDQARYGLIAYERFANNKTRLYDFTDMKDDTVIVDVKNMTDVKPSAWYYNDVAYILAKGIMWGTTSTTFGPEEKVTRGQFVTILGRYAGIKDSSTGTPSNTKFADVKNSQYYASHVTWAVEKGVTAGTSNTTFDPEAKISREDMSAMIQRYAKTMNITLPDGANASRFADDTLISGYAKDAVYSMKEAKIIVGIEGNRFDPKGSATRGQAARIIHLLIEL